jgi:hypothetical protein
MTGKAAIRAAQEDLVTPQDSRKDDAAAEIGRLHAPADRGLQPLPRLRRQMMGIEVHDDVRSRAMT